MIKNGEYQIALVNRLSFNRVAGTEEELRAAHILQEEIASFGGSSALESFKIPWYKIKKASLKVTAPFERELEVTAIGLSGSTPEEGISAELLYVEKGTEVALRNAKGKILLVNDDAYENWNLITASGALGYIIISGEYDDDPKKVDLPMSYLRKYQLSKGSIPGLTIRTSDAVALLHEGAEYVHFTVVQEETELESNNIISEIRGIEHEDEFIVLTAHYDSVPYSCGSWDNASGCADLMALYGWFLEHPPRRTMRFIWCGAEERGLLGSKAYVQAHNDELAKCRLCLNIDMTGPLVGYDLSIINGIEATKTMLEYMARERGHMLSVKRDIHGSDCTPFADVGIPTVSFARVGKAAYHSNRDLPYPLSAKAMAKTQDFIRVFLDRVVNSVEFPIPREIPQDMKDAIDKYYRR